MSDDDHTTTAMEQQDPLEPDTKPFRYDQQNRLLCTAMSRRSGELCKAPAMKGQRVCRVHGGASSQARRKAKLRLMELVDPAIATLAREMTQADKSADKQRAANSILDRAGFGRQQQVEVDDARALLLQQILKARGESLDDYADDPDHVSDDIEGED